MGNSLGVSEATANVHVRQTCSVKETTLLYAMRQNTYVWIKLILFINIALGKNVLTKLKARNSQQGALPE